MWIKHIIIDTESIIGDEGQHLKVDIGVIKKQNTGIWVDSITENGRYDKDILVTIEEVKP